MAEEYDRTTRLKIPFEELEWAKFKKLLSEKIAVRVCDEEALIVLNNILAELGGTAGTPHFSETKTTTTGALQTLITETVPVSTTRSLSKVVVVCNQSGYFEIKIAGSVVGGGRTGPASPNSSFLFLPNRAANAGEEIKVEFTQEYGKTGAGTSVEAYLMASDT